MTKVIAAPPGVVWEAFTDLARRASPLSDVESVDVLTSGPLTVGTCWRETRVDEAGRTVTEDLVITALQPGQSCTVALVGAESNHLTYVFTPIDVGVSRGATAVTAVAEARPHGLANRLLAFVVGGFAARTAEGALRTELDGLAAACRARASGRPDRARDDPAA